MSFGAYSLVVLAEIVYENMKGCWRRQKVAAGGCSCGKVKISRVMALCKGWLDGGDCQVLRALGLEAFLFSSIAPSQHGKGGGCFIAKNAVYSVKNLWDGFSTRVYWSINLKSCVYLWVQICTACKTSNAFYLLVLTSPVKAVLAVSFACSLLYKYYAIGLLIERELIKEMWISSVDFFFPEILWAVIWKEPY